MLDTPQAGYSWESANTQHSVALIQRMERKGVWRPKQYLRPYTLMYFSELFDIPMAAWAIKGFQQIRLENSFCKHPHRTSERAKDGGLPKLEPETRDSEREDNIASRFLSTWMVSTEGGLVSLHTARGWLELIVKDTRLVIMGSEKELSHSYSRWNLFLWSQGSCSKIREFL